MKIQKTLKGITLVILFLCVSIQLPLLGHNLESIGNPAPQDKFPSIDNQITAQPVSIWLSKTVLNFGSVIGAYPPPNQQFTVNFSGGASIPWVAVKDRNWINIIPQNGTGSGTVTVSVVTAGLAAGAYQGTINIDALDATNSPQTVNVNLNVHNVNSPPFGFFDTPTDQSTVRSSIPVTGWALDDVGVSAVTIYREPGAGEGNYLLYLGDANFVEGARPDVQQAYPGHPMNYRAGWGYMLLTNFLPDGGNGTYRLRAVAIDDQGQETSLGTKTIICDNANAVKPFGAIDTPTQGGTASGNAFVNWGWTLTPQPNSIPTDGSTINVFVDGANLGHPQYNVFRGDLAIMFPGYANNNGAAGYFYLDTTGYADGVHTIAWSVRDNAGNTDGIGSRYFSISNTNGGGSSRLHTENPNALSSQFNPFATTGIFSRRFNPIKIKKDSIKSVDPALVFPSAPGHFQIDIQELEQIEICLSSEFGLGNFSGFLKVGDQFEPLPIGSTLNRKSGIFSWTPGPGFLGTYELAFFSRQENGLVQKTLCLITIKPKY